MTRLDRVTDAIAHFSGSHIFLLLNAAVFAAWIAVNTPSPWSFDGYPFQLLTLAVSLEAIFLSLFILMSQNRQAAYDRRTNQHDLDVDMRAEHGIRELQQAVERVELLVKGLAE